MKRLTYFALVLAVILLPLHAAAQDDARRSLIFPNYQLGTVVDSGNGMYAKGGHDFQPTLLGYQFSERTSLISGLVFAGWLQLIGVGSAAAIAAPQNTKTTTSTSTNYQTGTKTVTTTTTGTVTAEQGRQAQSVLDASQAASGSALLMMGSSMDVTIYDTNYFGSGSGDGYGYNIQFWAPAYVGESNQFEIGWQLHDVLSFDHDNQLAVESYSFALPLRYHHAFLNYFYASTQLDLNFSSFFSHDDRSQRFGGQTYQVVETRPWALTAELHFVWWRLHAFAAVQTSRPLDFDLGYQFGAAARF